MKNPLKHYKFWIQAISAAILLIIGIWGIIDRDFLVPIVVGVTAAAILIFAVIRFIPLMKTLQTTRSRFLTIGEIAINILVGILLFYGSIMIFKDADEGFGKFMTNYYKYFLGGILYIRGLCYFICTVLFKEETDQIKFWSHIGFLTLGVLVCAIDGVSATSLAFVIAIFALLGAATLIVDAGFNYGKYRKYISANREKQKAKEEESSIAPGVDKPEQTDITDEIPLADPEEQQDQTYIN